MDDLRPARTCAFSVRVCPPPFEDGARATGSLTLRHAMLGLGPIGTLKGIKPTGGDAKKPGLGKKPATSTLDFEFSDDDEPGAPCPNARALQPQHRTHRLG